MGEKLSGTRVFGQHKATVPCDERKRCPSQSQCQEEVREEAAVQTKTKRDGCPSCQNTPVVRQFPCQGFDRIICVGNIRHNKAIT